MYLMCKFALVGDRCVVDESSMFGLIRNEKISCGCPADVEVRSSGQLQSDSVVASGLYQLQAKESSNCVIQEVVTVLRTSYLSH